MFRNRESQIRRATFATATVVAFVVAAAALVGLAYREGLLSSEPPARLIAAAGAAPAAATTAAAPLPAAAWRGFLFGRVQTVEGAVYEGRLRLGIDQEAFWNDYFNGDRSANPWLERMPAEHRPKERKPFQILGFRFGDPPSRIAAGRPLLVPFGAIARLDATRREVRLTLKSGSVHVLDRFSSSDFDDGVRVWDARRGVVDLLSMRIRSIELLPTPPLAAVPQRLQGTVRSRAGDFTGFVGWNWEHVVGSDPLRGRTSEGPVRVPFDSIRAIARGAGESMVVTLVDGREVALTEAANPYRGLYVDDERYGRVEVSWDAFERVDFVPGGSGPAYADFTGGQPLSAAVATRDGRRLAGRLAYDLDESETVETLDARRQGVHYTIPFHLVAAVEPLGSGERGARARVTLRSGEQLELEGTADVGDGHTGNLVVPAGGGAAAYVPWADVERVEVEVPPPPAVQAPALH